MNIKSEWKDGFREGIPIMLGYFSVSFGVGIRAEHMGLTALQASIMSLTNLTSAGQAAGIDIIAAGGTMLEMALTQFIINLRYALMSLSLTQKRDDSFYLPRKLLVSYGITDEIFAVSYGRKKQISPYFMYGLILISAFGWVLGTFLGAWAGNILPKVLSDALGIMLYGMFIAIVVPVAKKNLKVLFVVSIAIVLSLLFHFVFTKVSVGFAVILCAVIASAIGAWLFPHDDEEREVA